MKKSAYIFLFFLFAAFSVQGQDRDVQNGDDQEETDEDDNKAENENDINALGYFDTVLCVDEGSAEQFEDSLLIPFNNAGVQELTSLQYFYQYNNNTVGPIQWTGDVSTGETGYLKLPADIETATGSYQYTVYTILPNGVPDEDPTNDTVLIQVTNSFNPEMPSGNTETVCDGDSATFGSELEGDYDYAWFNNDTSQLITVSDEGSYTITGINDDGCRATTEYKLEHYDYPDEFFFNQDSLFCDYDDPEFVVSDVFESYKWTGNGSVTNRGFKPSSSGLVSLEVTDTNGCSYSDEIDVLIVDSPELSIEDEISACDQEQIEISVPANEYDPNYKYFWNGTEGGSSVTINSDTTLYIEAKEPASGCNKKQTVNVTFRESPEFEIIQVGILCEGNSTHLYVSNSYSGYEWSNGHSGRLLTVDRAGLYTVTAEDNHGCKSEDTIEVRGVEKPFDLGSDTSICFGDALVLNLQDKGTDFSWNDGSDGAYRIISNPAIYSVIVEDSNNCTFYDTLRIRRAYNPKAEFDFDVANSFVTLESNSLNADSISWIVDGQFYFGQNPEITFDTPGEYPIKLNAMNKCGVDSIVKMINVGVSSTNGLHNSLDDISLYPNPVLHRSEEVNIEISGYSGVELQVMLYSMNGKLIVSDRVTPGDQQTTHRMRLDDAAAGTYLMTFVNEGKIIASKKLVVK